MGFKSFYLNNLMAIYIEFSCKKCLYFVSANAPSSYVLSAPDGQPPMTPSSAYLPGTPGQPMTPRSGGLDMMSPLEGLFSILPLLFPTSVFKHLLGNLYAYFVLGAENEGPWLLPDILVNVHRSGEDSSAAVIREVLPDGSCRIALGSSGNGEIVTALAHEIEIV
ncbi:hypothetical protein ACS0TY_004299 [Phlomoides rotata]